MMMMVMMSTYMWAINTHKYKLMVQVGLVLDLLTGSCSFEEGLKERDLVVLFCSVSNMITRGGFNS